MKFTKRMKDLFIVKTPEGGTRLSKDMVTNTVVLASSVLVALGGVGQAIVGAEVAAITGGVVAVGNIVLRLTSDGGTIKAKETPKPDNDNDWFEGV